MESVNISENKEFTEYFSPSLKSSPSFLENFVSSSPEKISHNVEFEEMQEATHHTSLVSRSSSLFCRICLDGGGGSLGQPLISPCQCAGTVGLVHRSCVEKWLSTANQDTCELCRHKFRVSRTPRSFHSWVWSNSTLEESREHSQDHRNLLGDLLCFFLLTPLAATSIYLSASGAAFYYKGRQSEGVGLFCLTSLLVVVYIAWLSITIKYHILVWCKWRKKTHQNIRLEESLVSKKNEAFLRNCRERESENETTLHTT